MRQVARAASRAALGLGCMAGGVAHAAEWSFAPNVNWSVDYDSDRSLVPAGTATQSTSIATNADFAVATETNRLTLSPALRWQFFDTKAYGNIFERDLNAADSWTADRSSVDLTAKTGDNSTLTTEETQTGVLSSNLHQRLEEGGVHATYNETERYAAVLDADYSDVSYYGTPQGGLLDLLTGYQYATASLGEKAQLAQNSSLTFSVYRNKQMSRLPGNDTVQTGARAEYHNSFSERWAFQASVGGARVESPRSTRTSTTGSLNLSRSFLLGSVAFDYSRSLSPYGTGTLIQRQQMSLTGTRSLTEKLDLSMAASRVQNGQPFTQPAEGVEIPRVQAYVNIRLGLDWKTGETWSVGADVDWTSTKAVVFNNEPVHDWHASVSVTWTPRRQSTSF